MAPEDQKENLEQGAGPEIGGVGIPPLQTAVPARCRPAQAKWEGRTATGASSDD